MTEGEVLILDSSEENVTGWMIRYSHVSDCRNLLLASTSFESALYR